MTIERESGKDRWQRMPKDYFKHPDPLRRARLRLSAVAAVAALAWWASGLDWSRGGTASNDAGRYRVSRGPVARVHAAWDHKCDACHVPFAAIDGRPLLPALQSATADHSGADGLCSSCHKVGVHHQATNAEEVPSCAGCHRDHRGRDASLVRLADGDCTSCHGNLAAHTGLKGEHERRFGNVRQFDQDHPPFRPEAALFVEGQPPQDRSRLKFNHALHMRPGLVGREGDTPYTVARIPIAAERPRYRGAGKSDADPVQLDCASCHNLQASDGGSKPGGYYEPVAYETSCRACHALSFDPRQPDLMAPHGVQPPEVAAFVRNAYASQFLADDPKLLDSFVPTATIPGKTPEATRARQRLDDSVATAESLLFENTTNCRECHHVAGTDHGVVPAQVEPTNVPKVWFGHARFDHSAHRAVSCRDCHARAYAVGPDGKPVDGASTVNTDVLLPDIANCRACHNQSSAEGGWFARATSASGGASQDCVECHRYHGGDRPAHGAGSFAHDETPGRSIAEFLSGVTARPGP
ncbi:cytochrome c3 family protein [Tundrisphaera sp. TA3]|uniref:cytochrome c3 family protein n=1 Tax=Tundrisphaera sp. TA3 TaxID=3435775 RepID=UPI003EBB9E5E